MKALTLHQPWATLVAIGAKQFETRSWSTSYRGPIAIHAGAKWDRELAKLCQAPPFAQVLNSNGFAIGKMHWAAHRGYRGSLPTWMLHFSAIVAVARLDSCRICSRSRVLIGTEMNTDAISDQERAFGDFTGGRYAWRLENVRRLSEPYEIKGRQGLWDLPLDVARDLDRQMTLCP